MKLVNSPLGFQLDIPIEIVAPALVQIIGREALAMVLQLPAGRPDRFALQVHMRLARRAATLLEVARGTGGSDILPAGAAAVRTRDDMVESQFLVRPAIDA